MTNSTISQDFCIAFAERAGFDVPKAKDLTIDGDWLFHFDENYPDEMDIYQYPLADYCCEVYDTCTIEQFNDPKLRQAVIDKLDASIDAAIEFPLRFIFEFERSNLLGFFTIFKPLLNISKIPISFVDPNLFFFERIIR